MVIFVFRFCVIVVVNGCKDCCFIVLIILIICCLLIFLVNNWFVSFGVLFVSVLVLLNVIVFILCKFFKCMLFLNKILWCVLFEIVVKVVGVIEVISV